MAEIVVALSPEEVHAACRYWAVTRVLNEGKATGCTLVFNKEEGGASELSHARITVETERMGKPAPDYVGLAND